MTNRMKSIPIRPKPCMKNPTRVDCAIRHRRCPKCPYNTFFKPEKTTKPRKQ